MRRRRSISLGSDAGVLPLAPRGERERDGDRLAIVRARQEQEERDLVARVTHQSDQRHNQDGRDSRDQYQYQGGGHDDEGHGQYQYQDGDCRLQEDPDEDYRTYSDDERSTVTPMDYQDDDGHSHHGHRPPAPSPARMPATPSQSSERAALTDERPHILVRSGRSASSPIVGLVVRWLSYECLGCVHSVAQFVAPAVPRPPVRPLLLPPAGAVPAQSKEKQRLCRGLCRGAQGQDRQQGRPAFHHRSQLAGPPRWQR